MDYAKRAAKLVQCESNNGYWLTSIDGRYLADGHGENAADVTEQIRAWLAAELQAAHDAGVAEAGDVREVLADLLSAINEDQEALVSYFADVGAEHERDCPEDDTCECELIVAMHKAHKRLAGAVHDATKLLEER